MVSDSKIVIAVSQKLQIQDYVHRKTSTSAASAIDRLRSKVIKDAEEINDSLLGIEMSSVDGSDVAATTSSSSVASAALPDGAVPADSVDFYSPNRLPVDVSFMEFEPHTPPAEILLQFQRLNLLCAPALLLYAAATFSHSRLSGTPWCLTRNSTWASSHARLL